MSFGFRPAVGGERARARHRQRNAQGERMGMNQTNFELAYYLQGIFRPGLPHRAAD